MDEDQSKGFRIGLDEPGVEEEKTGPEAPEKKKKKPGKQRDTSIFILFLGFLVICLVLGWFYLDTRDRLQTINSAGSEEIDQLSRKLNNKLTDLDNRLAAFQKAARKKRSDIKGRLEGTEAGIEKLQAGISSLKKDFKPVEDKIENLEAGLSKLKSNVQSLGEEQSGIKTGLKKNSDKISSVTEELGSVSGSVEKISKSAVDKGMLDKTLKKEREFYKENMAHATEGLYSEVSSLQEELKALKGDLESLRQKMADIKQSSESSRASEPAESSGSKQPAEEMPQPQENEIIEQEIN